MSHTHALELERLFDELIELEPNERSERLRADNRDPELVRQLYSLLNAADRRGDFLGLLHADARDDSAPNTPPAIVAGRYRVERHIGHGAMGDVYLATDLQLERPVALKFLRAPMNDALDAHSDEQSRLIVEARAAAHLNHAHVATVYDVERDERGQLFIAMAYYAGDTLRDRIARNPLDIDESIRIARQVADALTAAHAAGIVHRDVKPANVLFDTSNDAKLADFGVAMRVQPESSRDNANGPTYVVGTSAYMSPEQARGESVDGRADLWALGVMLHEMLLGRRPGNDSDTSTIEDADLRNLTASLLAHDPTNRPANASDVLSALTTIAANRASQTAAAVANTKPSSFPHAVTSFVGRSALLDQARELIAHTRLLTLTGPGGTGKTRLAMQVALTIRTDFSDDVWFVPLADLSDVAYVPSRIARTFGIRDTGSAEIADRVIDALRSKQLLLVLDNFEQLLPASQLVARILAECANVTVLVASREPLAIQGEQELPVPPLSTPSQHDAHAQDSEAVELFVQRARAVRPDFSLDAQSTATVAEICRRLDGLPLALELAAARTKLLSPRAMLDRLENRLDLLRADGADRPARHRTLREVIDWSYVLLSDRERALFTRLAVFPGGISLDAAEQISAHADSVGADNPFAVFELLTSLCNKSLLRQQEQPDGDARFFLLETVREFALERLRAAGNDAVARTAFHEYCISFAERALPFLRGSSQVEWFGKLEREYVNLRAALDECIAQGESGLPDAARLAYAMHRLWLSRGPLSEGADYLRRIVALNDAIAARGGTALEPDLLANLLVGGGLVVSSQSIFPEMAELLSRSLAIQRRSGNHAAAATTINGLGWATWILGDYATGEALSREAMEMHRARGDEVGVALSHQNLGWVCAERAQFDQSEYHFNEAISRHRQRDDVRAASYGLTWLGVMLARRGDYERALLLHKEALAHPHQLTDAGFRMLKEIRIASIEHAMTTVPGDHAERVVAEYLPEIRTWGGLWPLAAALAELAKMLCSDGATDHALGVLEEELELRRRMGTRQGVAEARTTLSLVHLQCGDYQAALSHLIAAVEGANTMGCRLAVVEAFEAGAPLLLKLNRPDDACFALGAASRARGEIQARHSVRAAHGHAAVLAALRDTMDSDVFDEQWERGESTNASAAVSRLVSTLHSLVGREARA